MPRGPDVGHAAQQDRAELAPRRSPHGRDRPGRETLPVKRDVRKLTELGLTHSLAVGYAISPRGRAYLG